MAIRVLEYQETYRLIGDGGGRYSVVEVRCNHVYSLCGHPRRQAPDNEEGMAAVVGDGWADEESARRCFDAAVRGEQYLKQVLW